MIYTGFGNECTVVKRSGTGQMQFGELLTVRRASDGRELDYRACELKATDGIREIAGIVETLPDDEHPQTDEHLAGCTSCMMAHDKGLPDEPPTIENSGVIQEPAQPTEQDAAYIKAARAVWADDELEIDDSPVVSAGADNGAWVAAWVWVSDIDAGICSKCGAVNADNGEGYDGLCGSCADKAEAE